MMDGNSWPPNSEWIYMSDKTIEWKGRDNTLNRHPGYENEYLDEQKVELRPGEVVFDRYGNPRGVTLKGSTLLTSYEENEPKPTERYIRREKVDAKQFTGGYNNASTIITWIMRKHGILANCAVFRDEYSEEDYCYVLTISGKSVPLFSYVMITTNENGSQTLEVIDSVRFNKLFKKYCAKELDND